MRASVALQNDARAMRDSCDSEGDLCNTNLKSAAKNLVQILSMAANQSSKIDIIDVSNYYGYHLGW